MRKLLEPLANAWVGIQTHKLRSVLTIMGIVIGVGAVITLMSIGRGVQEQIISNISSMGSDIVTISPGATSERGVWSAAGSATSLTLEDAEAIAEEVPYVGVVAPYSSSSVQLGVGGNNTNSRVMGVTPAYQDAYNLEVAQGAFLSEYNYQSGSKVAVIGADLADTLFKDIEALGGQIRMGTSIVTVMGVLESEGTSMGFNSTDDAIFIPLSTLQQSLSQQRTSTGDHVVSSIVLTVTESAQTDNVVDDLTELLRDRHRLTAADEDDFTISSMEELLSTVSETTETMTLFLGAIAGIALLVGGIGVMNIMLVSVVERTREIGIRKALGARERDIWGQFLVESAVLSFSGGLIGVAGGWLVSRLISNAGLMGSTITTVVSSDIVALALGVSIGIGLLFGFLPARRAAALKPIEALRHE